MVPFMITADAYALPPASRMIAIRPRAQTPDTPSPVHHGSMPPLFLVPLAPPDRCYLAPVSSPKDYPYSEPWPSDDDHGKPRKPASSPLKMSFGSEAAFPEHMVHAWESSGESNAVQIWTSTPHKSNAMPGAFPGPFGNDLFAELSLEDTPYGPARNSYYVSFFDDASSTSSASNLFDFSACAESPTTMDNAENTEPEASKTLSKHPGTGATQHKIQPPVPEVFIWRRHGARVPGKSRSHSTEWYNASAFVSSPVPTLSPPKAHTPLSPLMSPPSSKAGNRFSVSSASSGHTRSVSYPGISSHGRKEKASSVAAIEGLPLG
ncbi:hypothetical protein HYDPIDRAFT_29972 [Hydnomerulius pinastri MD-312]|uniref:Unplaced genomic scaffold scaffold_19, whole genome shotgun sequence n=1 Tax=Hydnomerulius pinastri MD-312 TaxID=994086 RepID=A0A0C9W6Z6_9AGAM|nr:hypothetical protein HYDPIDRAFT_29972 [Hydnomerulius pinastri MD-312]